jgi:hypothetical protein
MLEDLFLYRVAARSEQVAAAGDRAELRSRQSADSIEQLTKRVGALELALETLLRMMVEKGKIGEEEFLQHVQKVDAEDGYIDGRRDTSKMRKLCPACRKYSSADRPRCMWCNGDLVPVKAELTPVIA